MSGTAGMVERVSTLNPSAIRPAEPASLARTWGATQVSKLRMHTRELDVRRFSASPRYKSENAGLEAIPIMGWFRSFWGSST